MLVRIYTGDDGKSFFEELNVLEERFQVNGEVYFRVQEPGSFIDSHTTARRGYHITLSGQLELTDGDGKKLLMGAGDVELAEDKTGKGHQGLVVGNQPRVSLHIPLE